MLKDIMTVFVDHGNLFGIMTIMALMIGYFKYLKPFLEDFDGVKSHLSRVTMEHKDMDNKLDVMSKLFVSKYGHLTDRLDEQDKSNIVMHDKIKTEVIGEMHKIGYRIEDISKRVIESDERNVNARREVAIDLTRIQSRLEYMSPSGARGLQK